LIFFGQMARDRTLTKLDQLLRPNGLMFLGCSETNLVDRQQYRPVPYPDTFAHYKVDTALANEHTFDPSIHCRFLSSTAALNQVS
jgi:hypothetical protein